MILEKDMYEMLRKIRLSICIGVSGEKELPPCTHKQYRVTLFGKEKLMPCNCKCKQEQISPV